MISYLKGVIILKGENFLILNVGGIGFRVFVSEKTLHRLPEKGRELEIFCRLDISDRAIKIFGFLKQEEMEFFKIIRNISGVGPSAALQISGLGSIEQVKREIEKENFEIFEKIPGIGKKKARKVILELSGKMDMGKNRAEKKASQVSEEAVSGLINLGFKRKEAEQAVSNISSQIKSPEKIIKEALKFMGQKKT